MNSDTPKPTTAAEWRKPREEGVNVPLPSGNWARIRPADIMTMIKQGTIPDLLSAVAVKAVWSEQDPSEIGEQFELAEKYDDLMRIVLPAVFAEPKIALDGQAPKDDEITIEDLDLADRTAAFNLALSGVGTMRRFRDEQVKRLGLVSNGENVWAATEQDSAD